MKQTTTATRYIKLRFWKKALSAITLEALLIMMLGNVGGIRAQGQNFTFMGDYDRTFAAPLGYYVDPERPIAPTVDTYQTVLTSGELLPDGSIVAVGYHNVFNVPSDFYLRKFTPTGAVDTSFGTNGFVRSNFNNRYDGYPAGESPQVLKVQPDGKIVSAGQCNVLEPSSGTPQFGNDACLVRYNSNGTLDTSFGNTTVIVRLCNSSGQCDTYSYPIGAGKVIIQTGIWENLGGNLQGSGGTIRDMAIQPDGKIVVVGETRDWSGNYYTDGHRDIGFVARFNSNGSLDTSFGTNGIARFVGQVVNNQCPLYRGLLGVRLQPDGRIIAAGYDSIARPGTDCFLGKRFVVTRWTANGQLETLRYLDNETTYNAQQEGAISILFTRDGNHILVSGAYKDLNPAGYQKPTMVRLNLGDLSLDTTFGTGGIRQYNGCVSGNCGYINEGLRVKAIQPDGKILGTDGGPNSGNIVRFNADGSSDQSFGNLGIDGADGGHGRLRVYVTHFNGISNQIVAGQILVRPNGRINLIGHSSANAGLGILRAAISQQNTVLRNGVYSDFENDGKTNFSLFRDGTWYWLNSTNNQFNGVQFGIAGDKPAPADYDGDGKTDIAVFRGGAWYILRSSNGQVSSIGFGTTGDLPRPGDFDGDGLADICVFRPSSGVWYILRSSDGGISSVQFGTNGDVPLLADFDGDGRSDISVFRNGIWYWLRSSDSGFEFVQLGAVGDIPVVGDYNGDSKSDPAVFRPTNGTWYTSLNPATNYGAAQFGQNGDVPVPGDYDNDGKNDLAVYRGGSWYVLRSGDNQVVGAAFGLSTDTPIPAAYLH